jgi:hypothetical protein
MNKQNKPDHHPFALRIVLILIIMTIAVQWVYPQTVKKGSQADTLNLAEIAREVGEFVEKQLIRPGRSIAVTDTALLRLLFEGSYGEINQADAYNLLYDNQIRAMRGDIGLRLSSNFQENFTPGILTEEDITYLRRLYLGIDWDLLNSGLFANKAKIKSIEKQREILQYQYQRESKQYNYLYLYSYLTYLFKREKAEILARRKEVVDEQVRVARKMYLLRITPWERLLELESKAGEIRVILNDNQVYFNQRLKESMPAIFMDEAMLYDYLPVFDIDADKMVDIYNRSGIQDKLVELQTERYKAENWRWNGFTLRPFFRYNILQTDPYTVKNYASAGISASMPLSFNRGRAAEVEAKTLIATNEQQINAFGTTNELLNHYYEFQFKKMQFTSFYYKKLKIEERLRKEFVMREFDDESYSPLRVMQILEEKLSVEAEIVDLKKDMYLKMLKIYTYLDVSNPNDFVKVVNPEELGLRYKGNRYLYIWSEHFTKASNEHLLAFIKNNEIREVLVSPGSANFDKFSDFVFLAQLQNIAVHLMIGENRLLDTGGSETLGGILEKYRGTNIRGIHLDIEPHTRNDFKTRRPDYMLAYTGLLNIARQYCDDRMLRLSVSIPMHYENQELEEIYFVSDQVFVMAYERPELDFVARKLEEELSFGREKTIIALSPDDFEDRLSMEIFIENLLKTLGLNDIALHDLRRLIDIDARSVHKVK